MARVTVRSSRPETASVRVTVSRGDGSAFVPIVSDLQRSGSQWSARIEGIPVGSGRRFDAITFDARGAPLDTGVATSDIVTTSAAVVRINVGPDVPPPLENAFPVIDSLSASQSEVAPSGVVRFRVSAHDPDPGDSIVFGWSASCGRFDSLSRTDPTWTAPATPGTCQLSVTVSDSRGAATTATLAIVVSLTPGSASVDVKVNSRPIIDSLTGNVRLGPTLEADLVVEATDPDGDPLDFTWSSDCPGATVQTAAPFTRQAPHLSVPAPSPACHATVAVTDQPGVFGGTLGTLTLPPNGGPGACVGVTCSATDACHVPGTCDPIAGICSAQTPKSCPAGRTCDPADGACKPSTDPCASVTCTATDLCHVPGTCAQGTCSPQTPKPCPTGQTCDPADGVCKPPSDACATVVCTASDLCHVPGTCSPTTGTCSPETPKVCPTGQACDVADGTCKPVSTTLVPRPRVAKAVPAVQINGLGQEVSGAAFLAGAVNCAVDVDTGTCASVPFDGRTVTPTGATDGLVVKYGADGLALWAVAPNGGVGDTVAGSATDQAVVGAAVTQNGRVAILGTTTGGFASGSVALPNVGPRSVLAFLDGSTGAALSGIQLNLGAGALQAVATSPSRNVVAVCGAADVAATDLVPGAQWGGPAGSSNRDVVLAVFDAVGGARVWSRQLGAGSDEECDALTVDDAGDVWAAGKYNTPSGQTPLNPGLGALPSTSSQNFRYLWLAKYRGSDGTPLAQAAFGAGPGNHTPRSLAVDASGGLYVGGSFTFTLPFGNGTAALASAGNTDGFVARLVPNASGGLDARWAVRIGNAGSTPDVVSSIALASTGDVLAGGTFSGPGTTTGAAALVNAGGTDAFLLELAGNTGATLFASAYGDGANQSVGALVVNRMGSGSAKDLVAFAGANAGSVTFPSPAGTVPLSSSVWYLAVAGLLP